MILTFLLVIFAVFAVLMFTRKMPALIALPAMAILIAIAAGLPFTDILNNVIAQGATKLAAVYVAVFAGAMMGRVMIQTGIAEEIIKRAAEFGGDKPLVVAFGLMTVTAILFTTLQGLGAIITVGSLVLPIMMSLGIPRKLAGILFLLAFGTGFIFNPALFLLYKSLLGSEEIPAQVPMFAFILIGLMVLMVVTYAVISAKRSGEVLMMSEKTADELLKRKKKIPLIALLTPVIPLILYFGVKYILGIEINFIAAFIIGSLFAVLAAGWRGSMKTLTSSAIKGIEDGAPAAILMMGIGMLLNALSLPEIKASLEPLISSLPLSSPIFYVAAFGLLSPLALYRGPLNIFGIGAGLFTIMFGLKIIPAIALLAAIMCVVQVQNICDPTNTHNVWVANYTGVRVEEITKDTLLPMMLVCIVGLIIGAMLFLR